MSRTNLILTRVLARKEFYNLGTWLLYQEIRTFILLSFSLLVLLDIKVFASPQIDYTQLCFNSKIL